MQLPLLPHLQLSSISPVLHLTPLLLSTAGCSFLSAPLQLSSPLRDAASYPRPSSAALLSISPLLNLTPLLLFSDLHCVMQLPLLPHLQLSSSPVLHLTPLLLSTAGCSFLSSPLQLSSPLRDAASYPRPSSAALLSISPPSNSSAALHCGMQLPLLSSAALLSTAWCSFLSSLICSSPLLHLTPLLLRSPLRDAALLYRMMQLPLLLCSSPLLYLSSAAALHCVMQLPLLSHMQLSSAWCSFLSSAALLHFSSPHLSSPHLSPLLSTAWCSFLSSLICSSPPSLLCAMQLPLLLSHLQLSSPPSNSSAALLWSPLRAASCPPLQLSSPPSLLLRSPLHDAAFSPLICSSPPFLSSAALHCVMQIPLLSHLRGLLRAMQLPLLPHLQLSSPPSLLHLTPLLLSTARCSFLSSLICSSPLLHLSSILLLCCSPLRDAASYPPSSAALLHLSSPPSNSSAALLLWSPLRDAASCPPWSAALLWSFSPLLLSSDLHCVMQLPLLLTHLQLSSPPSLLRSPLRDAVSYPPSSAVLLSSIWFLCCSLLSSITPPHDAASPLICSSPPFLLSPISPLSPPLLSTAWCSFLSSSLICNSPLLHLTPLLLSSSGAYVTNAKRLLAKSF